ncbi:nicotinate-nucleotide adenylyltransferase [Crocosphaera sp. XPORK-15E]|uniref:nicotinate-nucleotide adenylyltransferase n=1 Tax=Crocosphaera sp. XPORK-15E TaxID=3110247 RepID=UPI002B21606D|nr:nicotinate-nucleotide adenylyltransferase [Crocosphaera sp. XPORK-15E]MEA5535975.1 nicotinate-nucleotide adenylyltransferase [Crocosphaera sp. XPORK-15E]
MTKIALFGTSADPPTAGHKSIIRWLSDHYDWVGVWASDNPFKEHQTSLDHRIKMLQLLIDHIEPTRHNIYLSKGLSHRRSLISVAKAKEIWGQKADYTLVIGSDLLKQIRQWYHVQELLAEVSILVVPRPGYLINESDLQALAELGGNYQVADLDAPAVSSTAYRKHRDEDVLIRPIQDYIHQEQLYP